MVRYSVTLSLLALIVILLRAIFKKRLSARLVYGLWLVVLIKMCIPFSVFELDLNLPDSLGFLASENILSDKTVLPDEPNQPQVTPPTTQKPDISGLPEDSIGSGTVKEPENPDIPENTPGQTDSPDIPVDPSLPGASEIPAVPAGPAPSIPQDPQPPQQPIIGDTEQAKTNTDEKQPANTKRILNTIWLCGACTFALWFSCAGLIYFSRLRRGRVHLEKIGNTHIYLSGNADTPCLAGRTVYLTPNAHQSIHRDLAVKHELTHLHHGDHIWSVVRIAALCVFWWNPLIWVSAILSRQDSELACDEAVIESISEDERIPYARLIVDMIPKKKLYAVGLGGGSLKKRIIALTATHKKHIVTAVCVVLALALIAAATLITVNNIKERPADDSSAENNDGTENTGSNDNSGADGTETPPGDTPEKLSVTFFNFAKTKDSSNSYFSSTENRNIEFTFDDFDQDTLDKIGELFESVDIVRGEVDLSRYTPFFMTDGAPYKITASNGKSFEFQYVTENGVPEIIVKTGEGKGKWLTADAAQSFYELCESYGLTEGIGNADNCYFIDYNVFSTAVSYAKLKEIVASVESWFRQCSLSGFAAGEFSFRTPHELSDRAMLVAYYALSDSSGKYDISQSKVDDVLSKYFYSYDFDITRCNLDIYDSVSGSTYHTSFINMATEAIKESRNYDITITDVIPHGKELTFTVVFAPDACLKKTYTLRFYDGGYYFQSVTDDLTLNSLGNTQRQAYSDVLNSKTPFIMSGKQTYLSDYIKSLGFTTQDNTMFSLVDIDQDGLSEIIIALPRWSSYGSLILSYYNGTVYAEGFGYRSWLLTKVNGIAATSSGASYSDYVSAKFNNGILEKESVFSASKNPSASDYGYFIGDKKVTQEQWESYENENYWVAPQVVFYPLNTESIEKALYPINNNPADVSISQFTLYGTLGNRWFEEYAQQKSDFDVVQAAKTVTPSGEEYYYYARVAVMREYMIFTSQKSSDGKVIIPCVTSGGLSRTITLTIPEQYSYNEVNPVLGIGGGGSTETGVILQLKNKDEVYYLLYDNYTMAWNSADPTKLECVGRYELPGNWFELGFGALWVIM